MKTPAPTALPDRQCPSLPAPCGRRHPCVVRTLGAGWWCPSQTPGSRCRGQAVLAGEGQGLDVPGELHEDFSSRSMMSWSWFRWVGLLWVLRVGDSLSHLLHLLPSLHTRPDMLAQVHSVPSVSARSRWSEGSRSLPSIPIPSLSLAHPTSLFQRVPAPTSLTPVPSKSSAGTPLSIPTPPRPTKPRTHPMPITQPNSNLILPIQLRPRTHTSYSLIPTPHSPQAPHTPLGSALQ